MADQFAELPFEEMLKPENWAEQAGLHTPTFEAFLNPDGSLYLRGVALRDGFSPEAAVALTRFLAERVTVPPLPPVDEMEGFTSTRVDDGGPEL